ncbi:hypothetical protein ES703_18464 [subsurface metagenome]
MAEVYFFTETEKLPSALDLLGIEDFKGVRVPIKLHMGEPGNRYYISPSFVKLTVDRLKEIGAEPFLFDTTVSYPSPRATRDGYKRAAYRHGFSEDKMGCGVVIGAEGVEVIEGGHSFEVAKEMYENTHFVVVSHVKGHIQTGFGGAIKNLGMGGMTRSTKRMIHRMSKPKHLAEKCDLCGSCAEICPCNAITVDSDWKYDRVACLGCGECVFACPNEALSYEVMHLQKGLALATKACIRGKRVLYINALVNIARGCDCESNPGPIICPDIGYLASNEPVAIDSASLQLINEVKPGVFEQETRIDPSKQVRYAQEIGLPGAYKLRRL